MYRFHLYRAKKPCCSSIDRRKTCGIDLLKPLEHPEVLHGLCPRSMIGRPHVLDSNLEAPSAPAPCVANAWRRFATDVPPVRIADAGCEPDENNGEDSGRNFCRQTVDVRAPVRKPDERPLYGGRIRRPGMTSENTSWAGVWPARTHWKARRASANGRRQSILMSSSSTCMEARSAASGVLRSRLIASLQERHLSPPTHCTD